MKFLTDKDFIHIQQRPEPLWNPASLPQISTSSPGGPFPRVRGQSSEADHSSLPVRLNDVHKDNNYCGKKANCTSPYTIRQFWYDVNKYFFSHQVEF
jgi:hypothetical protein